MGPIGDTGRQGVSGRVGDMRLGLFVCLSFRLLEFTFCMTAVLWQNCNTLLLADWLKNMLKIN